MADWQVGKQVLEPGVYWILSKHRETGKNVLFCHAIAGGKAQGIGNLGLAAYGEILAYKPVEPTIEILQDAAKYIGDNVLCKIDGQVYKCSPVEKDT